MPEPRVRLLAFERIIGIDRAELSPGEIRCLLLANKA
jgi:hypothetical protein